MKLRVESDETGITLTMYTLAGENQFFAAYAPKNLIGQRTPIFVEDEPVVMGTVESAEIVDDGKAMKLTVKLDKNPPELRDLLENRRNMH